MRIYQLLSYFAAAVLCIVIPGCDSHAAFVEPTGWETVSPRIDSLTRAIELSFQNGAGPDSTAALIKQCRSVVPPRGMELEIRSRLLYWQGRLELRRRHRALGYELLDSAAVVAPPSTREYIERMNEWRREDIADYPPGRWYERKLDQDRYFRSRNDRQMIYNINRELMELMRDAGLHDRALHYLEIITECNRLIDPQLALLDDKMNRAALLSDMDRDEEAARLNRELQADTAYMREPVNCQLVNLNLRTLAGDTAALHAAYASIVRDGDRAGLLPKVYYYLVDEAIAAENCMEAARWADSLKVMLPRLAPGTLRVKALKGIARSIEMCRGEAAAAPAYRSYALAADSLAGIMRSDNVANLELSHAIARIDARAAAERRSARLRMAVWLSVAVAVWLLAMWLLLRRYRAVRLMRSEAEHIRQETRHRQIALQLDFDRRGLGSEIGSDNFIELFARQYPMFISRLRQKSPRISDAALRLAGYIAIGLSTKEIAEVMNVRPESVRQAKWRLRRTLGIVREEDLYPLLSSLLDQ